MDIISYLVDALDRETTRSRRALEQVPADRRAWTPHERSMDFGYLADMVANIPTWITMIITQDELDVAPRDRQAPPGTMTTSAQYLAALDKAAEAAREALTGTSEAHLQTTWRLLAGGAVVMETSRLDMIRDTLHHWVHHRGQMTVYLRLMGATVPALYGPSVDDTRFD